VQLGTTLRSLVGAVVGLRERALMNITINFSLSCSRYLVIKLACRFDP